MANFNENKKRLWIKVLFQSECEFGSNRYGKRETLSFLKILRGVSYVVATGLIFSKFPNFSLIKMKFP